MIFVAFIFLPAIAAAQQKQKSAKKQPRDATIWVNTPPAGALPKGVAHHTYGGQSMGHDVGYCIYLPPGYEHSSSVRYPVIYNLHGAGGDELRGLLAAEVLQEGIEAKRWPEMIIVFPNGGKTTLYKDSYRADAPGHRA